ncbi:MAG: hypothetical protein QXR45_14285, partial [Candidatus Bathyarchaeia archaeon]
NKNKFLKNHSTIRLDVTNRTRKNEMVLLCFNAKVGFVKGLENLKSFINEPNIGGMMFCSLGY